MADVPGTPTNPISKTASTSSVNDLIPQLFNQQLAEESVLGSIWDKLSGMATVSSAGKSLDMPANSVMMKVNTTIGGKIPSKIQIGMEMALQECPREGTTETNDILGNEENVRMKQATIYYNEIAHALKSFGWGMNYNELNFYGLKSVTTKLIRYFGELHDRRTQEAILLTVESSLTKAPVSVDQMFNPNWFVPNTAICDQPSYDCTDQDASTTTTCVDSPVFSDSVANTGMIENIGDALWAATSEGADGSVCMLLVEGLLALEQYLEQNIKMPKVRVGGKECWVYAMPTSHAKVLKNPMLTGSLGSLFKEGTPDSILAYPGVIGMFGSLLIVENPRYPTLTLSGSNGAWTLQPGFMQPGNNDGRNTACFDGATSGALNYVFHIGYVLGMNALIEWIANPLQMNLRETTQYNKIIGDAAYTCAGIQIVKYDNDTKSDSTYYCNSSCIVPVAAPNIITHV